MTASPTHVIVGAGLAGANAARALREEGFDGRIVLIGDEAQLPYDRPPLSKQYLRGETSPDDIRVLDADGWAQLDVDLVLGTAVDVVEDPCGQTPPGHAA